MGKAKWVGELRSDLFYLTWSEFHKKHPDIKKNTYKGKLAYWRAQLRDGRIDMPEQPKLVKSWEVSAFNRETNEWETTLNHAYDYAPSVEELAEQYKPIEPAIIHPTTYEAPKRPYSMLLVYGDGQAGFRRRIDPVTGEMELIPLHNIPMHRIIQQINAEYQPEETVNLGDFADMAELSRFPKDSDHFHKTLGPTLRWIHDFYAQMVCDNPNAKHTEVDSNHAIRPKKRILETVDALYDLVLPGEDYPILSYYRLANLGKLAINFISGYGAAEYVYQQDSANPIVFKHGVITSSVPGATMRKEAAENPSVNVVRGHGHGDEEVRLTARDGHQLVYKMLGSSCLNNGPVPGARSAVDDHNRPVAYHNQKHVNTFLIIQDYGEGRRQYITVDVIDGIAVFNEKEYNGNE